MGRDEAVEIAVRMKWMRQGVPLVPFLTAEMLLRSVDTSTAKNPDEVASDVLDRVPSSIRTVSRLVEEVCLPLVVLASISWFGPEISGWPGYLGLGGIAALVTSWAFFRFLLRVQQPQIVLAGLLIGLTLPGMLAVELAGPDIGLGVPPAWMMAPLGLVGAASFIFAVVRSQPFPADVSSLATLWRAGGADDGSVEEMSQELSDLAESRAEAGTPLSDSEWISEGFLVDLPDAVDHRRAWTVLGRVVASGLLFAAVAVGIDAIGTGEWTGDLDGSAIRLALGLMGLASIPAIMWLRHGRWMMIVLLTLVFVGFLAVPNSLVVADISLLWIGTVLVAALVLLVHPMPVRKILDRFL